MNQGQCPHCGNHMADDAVECPCGFNFIIEETVPGPAVARAPAAVAAVSAQTRTAVLEARPNTAMLMDCPTCGSRISKRAELCPTCDSAPYANCQICAGTILAHSSPCPECGDPDPFELD